MESGDSESSLGWDESGDVGAAFASSAIRLGPMTSSREAMLVDADAEEEVLANPRRDQMREEDDDEEEEVVAVAEGFPEADPMLRVQPAIFLSSAVCTVAEELMLPCDLNQEVEDAVRRLQDTLAAAADRVARSAQAEVARELIYRLSVSYICSLAVRSQLRSVQVLDRVAEAFDAGDDSDDTMYTLFPRIAENVSPIASYISMHPEVLEEANAPPPTRKEMVKAFATSYFTGCFPPKRWIRSYRRKWLLTDCVSGLTVGIMGVPMGMAYARIAELEPVVGLYAMVVPVLVYALLGTSRELAVGPFALVSLLVAAAVEPIVDPETKAAEYAETCLTLMAMVGLFLVLLGALKQGYWVTFFSPPVLHGFTSAAGLVICVNQFRSLFGLEADREPTFIGTVSTFFKKIDTTNWVTLMVGLACIAILVMVRVWNKNPKKKECCGRKRLYLPGPLIVVVVSTLFTWGLKLAKTKDVQIVGDIPAGPPPFTVPKTKHFQELLFPAALIALVAYMASVSVAKQFETSATDSELDGDQEMVALGAANVVGSFFGAYPISGSLSRTVVNAQAGARSQVSGMLQAATVFSVLMVATGLLFHLPNSALASIIVVAASSLVQPRRFLQLWRLKRADAVVWAFSFLATLLIGIAYGVLAAVVFSVLAVVFRASKPHVAELGRIPGSQVYRSVERFPEALVSPGMRIVRFDSSFFFANTGFVRDALLRYRAEPASGQPLSCLVMDWSTCSEVDSAAVDMLGELITLLEEEDVLLLVACVSGPVRDALMAADLVERVGRKHFFWQLHDAVRFGKKWIRSLDHVHLNRQARAAVDFGARTYSPNIFDTVEASQAQQSIPLLEVDGADADEEEEEESEDGSAAGKDSADDISDSAPPSAIPGSRLRRFLLRVSQRRAGSRSPGYVSDALVVEGSDSEEGGDKRHKKKARNPPVGSLGLSLAADPDGVRDGKRHTPRWSDEDLADADDDVEAQRSHGVRRREMQLMESSSESE